MSIATIFSEDIILSGKYCELLPLTQQYCSELCEAVEDGKLYKLWFTTVPAPEKMQQDISDKLKKRREKTMFPFIVIDKVSGKPIGVTTYLNVEANHNRLEIGSTWYRQSVQRTGINTEAKLLLLTYAFEKLNCLAVELRTHVVNKKSRNAIERLGAKLDGILRHHMIMPNGSLRDTCVYSILATEWPQVKIQLENKLK